ncbi:uncharacterized protein LOC120428844 [Culex pipiens pallens]|uniref:uncharacterized protein LOC120428844 n=2 Tax=Culex pipiens pallens TaxID=42434 RepID=UPI001954ED41|nr:uncharacterized protein LOC120428844 [Culex pipiens pallens]XP_039449898.1 uncharacterized protein LOC120428844 [Culex pipiens pallens]
MPRSDAQAKPWNDLLGTDHQGHANPGKLPHRLPTAYAPAPAPEDVVKFNLERCNLALLHQQNTGRFFIVLFEKKKKLLSEVFHQKPPSKTCEAEPPQKKLKRYHRNPLNLLTRCREDKKKNTYWSRRVDTFLHFGLTVVRVLVNYSLPDHVVKDVLLDY